MPLLPAQHKTLEVKILGRLTAAGAGDVNCHNVFHYRRQAFTVAPSKSAFLTAFAAAIVVPLAAACHSRWAALQLSARWLDDSFDRDWFQTSAGVGAIATDSQPTHDAVSMLLRTEYRGGNYRGSKHFGGVNEIDTTGDILTGAGLTRWTAVRDALRLPIVDASPNTWKLIVVSRDPALSDFSVLPTVYEGNDVTEVEMNLRVGSMARRASRQQQFAP